MLSLYIAVFVLLSLTISFAPWPRRMGRYGVILGGVGVLLALWLGGQLQEVSGSWFALSQRFTWLAREGSFPGFLGPLLGQLAVVAWQSFPGMAHELSMALVWLFVYLLLRLCLAVPVYLSLRDQPLPPRKRRAYRPWRGGLTLVTLLLILPLAALPLGVALQPDLRALVSTPLWVAGWIVLLELRLWVSRCTHH